MVKESLGDVWCLSVNSEVTSMLLASDGGGVAANRKLSAINLKAVQALKSWALKSRTGGKCCQLSRKDQKGKEDPKFLCVILTVLSSKRKKLTVGAKQGDGHALTPWRQGRGGC